MPWKLKNPAAADIAPDWLQPYCTQFLRKLSDQGYAAVTLRSYDRAAALLCQDAVSGVRATERREPSPARATPLIDRPPISALLERIYAVFPKLTERRHQRAGTMSGE